MPRLVQYFCSRTCLYKNVLLHEFIYNILLLDTRFWTKMKGDLTDDQMLRIRNSFIVLKRNTEAERLVILGRPTYCGRRHSVVVPNRVNEPEPEHESEFEPQTKAFRKRSASVDDVSRKKVRPDQNLDEFRAMLEAKISQGKPIDEEDDAQYNDSQENDDQVDNVEIEESQVGQGEMNESQSEQNQELNVELAESNISNESTPANDSGFDSGIYGFNFF